LVEPPEQVLPLAQPQTPELVQLGVAPEQQTLPQAVPLHEVH
jgi:hypothetical protein